MKTVTGDLILKALDGDFDVIIHGCNCMCTMGAGIAKGIKNFFPQAYEADLKTKKGDKEKLGTCTFAACKGRRKQDFIVVNAYTQYEYKGKGILVDYNAIRSSMKYVKDNFSGKRIGLPKIGAGLAKGDWEKISGIIEDELTGEDVTLVEYNK